MIWRHKSKHLRKNRLRWYRQQIGYTQTFVAKLLGHKSNARVSDYERGKRIPQLETAMKLEIILCTPLCNLFPGSYQNFRGKINPMRERLKRESASQIQELK